MHRPHAGGPLPGGLSVRAARRHVSSAPPAWRRWFDLVVVLGAITMVAGINGAFGWVAVFGALTALALVAATRPPGVRVTVDSQPQLWTAVAQTAATLGLPMPRRVWLTHRPEVAVVARRRRCELRVGLPLLACLSEHEVRALVAHELAPTALPRPDLVVPLIAVWRGIVGTEPDLEPSSQDVDDAKTEKELREFARTVEKAADAAAVAAAGSRPAAARAIAVGDGLQWTLMDFDRDLDLPPRPAWQPWRLALEDVDDVWREFVRTTPPPGLWDRETAGELARQHPDLAELIAALSDADLTIRPPVSPIPVRPLDRHLRRRLTRRFLGIWVATPVVWRTVPTAAPWWPARARRSVDRLRAQATNLGGREPTDHVELAELFLGRYDDWVAMVLGRWGKEVAADTSADEPTMPPVTPPTMSGRRCQEYACQYLRMCCSLGGGSWSTPSGAASSSDHAASESTATNLQRRPTSLAYELCSLATGAPRRHRPEWSRH